MNGHNYITTRTIAIPAPPGMLAWEIWFNGETWDHDNEPMRVLAILIGTTETSQIAEIRPYPYAAHDGERRIRKVLEPLNRVDFPENSGERWFCDPVAMLCIKDDCADFDGHAFAIEHLAFSESAAKAICARKNSYIAAAKERGGE